MSVDVLAGSLATRFADLIDEVRAGAVARELDRVLPIDLVRRLAEAGVGAVRLPVSDGGAGASIAEATALTIALSAADSNVGHLLRSHQGFAELVLRRPPGSARDEWVERIAGGALVGNATSELTGTTLADISTRVSEQTDGARADRTGGGWVLDGRKFYSTGTLYSDWVYLAAADGDARVTFAVPTDAPGVTVLDDWDGFGQRATASGTTVFDGVAVDPASFATYGLGPLTHIQAFYQLHLVAVLAGIAEEVVRDAADFVRPRSRSYVHANTARPADDPQVLEVVGRLSTTAFAVRAATLEAARLLDLAAGSAPAGEPLDARLLEEAEVAVYRAQLLATDEVPAAATRLFEVGGASATERTRALDRHWRNARVVASHNPAIFKARTIGACGSLCRNPGEGATMTTHDAAPTPPAGSTPRGGVTRRDMLTLATAGVALSTLTVTVGALSPATAAHATGADGSTASPVKRELRAMWISSVVNIDWPSASGLSAEQQQAELVGWLDVAKEWRLNAVFVQVRPTADAFWPSPLEPWSQYLTGVQGQDPGYDPLGFLVAEAHARDLELHAWYNPYRVSMQADPAQLVPEHPARVHPEWVWAYGGKLYFDPGLPETQAHIVAAIMDSVDRYDIDGVHFDDYFYPYAVAGETIPDAATFATYGAGFATVDDWRRRNVDTFVQTMSEAIKASKPWVKVGISPFGIWRNATTDPLGSATSGSQSFDMQFADTRRWVLEGWLDYVNPQIYWQIGLPVADFAALLPWWADVAAQSGTHLYVGEALYKVTSGVFTDPAELANHIALGHSLPQPVHGSVYFSAKHVPADPQGAMTIVRDTHWQHPAIVPAMEHLPRTDVRAPLITTVRAVDGGVRVRWVDTSSWHRAATSFAIYRVDGWRSSIDVADATALLGTVRASGRGQQEWVDASAVAGTRYTYVVTALDRVWNESGACLPRWVG